MLTSRQLMKRVGISRATLNNYVQFGILPKPVVKKAEPGAGRAPRIGYFPESAIRIIQQVAELKRRGVKMVDIVSMIDHDLADEGDAPSPSSKPQPAPERRRSERRELGDVVKIMPGGESLQLTLDQVSGPA
ncbi:MAG: hypothetical protein V3R37_09345, partial [Rhodospirillales bacterium]